MSFPRALPGSRRIQSDGGSGQPVQLRAQLDIGSDHDDRGGGALLCRGGQVFQGGDNHLLIGAGGVAHDRRSFVWIASRRDQS